MADKKESHTMVDICNKRASTDAMLVGVVPSSVEPGSRYGRRVIGRLTRIDTYLRACHTLAESAYSSPFSREMLRSTRASSRRNKVHFDRHRSILLGRGILLSLARPLREGPRRHPLPASVGSQPHSESGQLEEGRVSSSCHLLLADIPVLQDTTKIDP